MKILIYGINYWPELTGIGKYSGEMAEWFASQDHDVRVVTAPPYYPEWKVKDGYSAWFYKKEVHKNVVIYRSPIFVPKKPKLITRVLHLISHAFFSFPTLIKQLHWKPDVILFVQPTLFASFGAIFLARLSKSKSVMHIQDYEVDAMFGLGMMNFRPLEKIAKIFEKWIMGKFDTISSISYSMLRNAALKGVPNSKLVFFPNWADTKFVSPSLIDSSLRSQWGFSRDDKIILYAGNIGEKQGLELVLNAAEEFKDKPLVNFLIVGTGAHVDVLKKVVAVKQLNNVYFKPLQPWARVPEMLAMADIHLVVQKRGAADVVLPSKLTNILSMGGYALVTAEKDTELGVLADRFPGIYQCVAPESLSLFTEALQKMIENEHGQPNQIARDYAVQYLSKQNILSSYEKHLKILVGAKSGV